MFFPRQKEGEESEPAPLTRHIRLNYESLQGLFYLSLKHAAREVGLCPTTFKKACRRFNISKWPSRKGQREAAIARRNAQTDARSENSSSSSSSTVLTSGLHFSRAAPNGPLQQALAALDTRSCGEARYAGPVFPHKIFDAPSHIDASTRGSISIGMPKPEGAAPREAGPPRERSCVEAVMDYLDRGCSISEAELESMLSDE